MILWYEEKSYSNFSNNSSEQTGACSPTFKCSVDPTLHWLGPS